MATLIKVSDEEKYIEAIFPLTERNIQELLGGLQDSIYFNAQQEYMFVHADRRIAGNKVNLTATIIMHERLTNINILNAVHGDALLCDATELKL